MTVLKRLYLDLPTEVVDKIKANALMADSTLKNYVTQLLMNDLADNDTAKRGKKHGTRKKAKQTKKRTRR